jgi:hypothetical protein
LLNRPGSERPLANHAQSCGFRPKTSRSRFVPACPDLPFVDALTAQFAAPAGNSWTAKFPARVAPPWFTEKRGCTEPPKCDDERFPVRERADQRTHSRCIASHASTLPDSEQPGDRPDGCPFCDSKAIGTPAKVVTTTSYWRCQACGEVWNVRNLRATHSVTYRQGRR